MKFFETILDDYKELFYAQGLERKKIIVRISIFAFLLITIGFLLGLIIGRL